MSLAEIYEAYIAYLNARDLNRLDEYAADSVIYNVSLIGLAGYHEMLGGNYRDIPDLRFVIDLLLSDPSAVASRLRFDCRPKAEFLGLRIGGRNVVFQDGVFYRFAESRIREVWSVIDKGEMEKQLNGT